LGKNGQDMRIGQLARSAGVGIDTVRHYERLGLLPDPGRHPSGYRSYGSADRDRLRFIRRGKELGFTLSEVATLLALGSSAEARAADILELTRSRIDKVGRQLADLQRIERALEALADDCPVDAPAEACPIMVHLNGVRPNPAAGHADPSRPLHGAMIMDMKHCIDLCHDCHRVCLETLAHCLNLGGKHAEAGHINALLDCITTCNASFDMMVRNSPVHAQMCATCAEACRRCAESCEAMDDPQCRRCAEICRACEASCREMGAHAHHHA
jgi:MerR family mercuric resistance operon transcriptional regulator